MIHEDYNLPDEAVTKLRAQFDILHLLPQKLMTPILIALGRKGQDLTYMYF